MKKIIPILALTLAVPFLTNCSSGKLKTYYVTFHQEGVEDVRVSFNSETLQSEIEIQEPDILKKDGYSSSWEEYSIIDKKESFTVNALYVPITYYAAFKAQGVLVEEVPFTIADITSDHSKLPSDREPAIPNDSWANPYWEDYSLTLNNIVVKAKYDVLKTFEVSFVVNGEEISEPITISRDDLDADGNILSNLIPETVKNYKIDNYEISWNFHVDSAINQTIEGNVYLHPYYIKFVDFDGEQIGELMPYTIENETWESVNKPDAPELIGYDTYWNDATLTYSDDDIVVATPNKTGKTYYITYEGYTDPQAVTYGSEYVLEHPSTALQGWVDEDGHLISNNGIWNIPNNITVSVEAKTLEDFSSLTVPNFIDVENSLNITDVMVSEETGMDGSNALQFTVSQESDWGLKVKKSYLDEVFADSNVSALTFVAKGSKHCDNFRHRTGGTNITYEINNFRYGLDVTYQKFSFTRAMYQNHVESDFMIYGGMPYQSSCKGLTVFIDSFLYYEDDVMNDLQTKLSFENGTVYKDGNSIHWRTLYGTGSSSLNDFFINDTNNLVTSFGYSNDMRTDGVASLTFDKKNGYVALYFGTYFRSIMFNSPSQTIAFDIYSTVYINSNNNVKNLTDGMNRPFTDQGGKLVNNKWTTFILDKDSVTSDARFLIIQGSTEGTFYIDNFRVIDI